MDPLCSALSLYRRRQFQQCIDLCTEILNSDDQQNQAAWLLKMRSLTQLVTYDDIEVMDSLVVGGAGEHAVTATARAGTSLAKSSPATGSSNQTGYAQRPGSKSARPKSGVIRLTNNGSSTASNATGRLLSRLATASLPESRSFVNVARLNLSQCSKLIHLAKPLFEYLYFVQGDVRKSLELANFSLENAVNQHQVDPYWQCAASRCLIRLGLVRQVIQDSTSDWYVNVNQLDGFLLMAKAFLIIDQPLSAIQVYQKGVDKFTDDVCLLVGIGRIYEELHRPEESISSYKKVLLSDASNVEAIACIASHFFYNGQPELALVLYRRLLQMGIHTAEIFNNIALCCLNTQQFDLIIPCIEKALTLANDNILADVWYNLGSVALAANNLELSALCWRLALFYSPNHSEASNNLGVLAMIAGNTEEGKILFNAALSSGEIIEARQNLSEIGNETFEQTIIKS